MYLSIKSKSINNFKFLILSKPDGTICIIFFTFIYVYPGAHSNTQTSFKNKAFVFSESDRSEAVDDQGCSLDKCVNWTIFLSC